MMALTLTNLILGTGLCENFRSALLPNAAVFVHELETEDMITALARRARGRVFVTAPWASFLPSLARSLDFFLLFAKDVLTFVTTSEGRGNGTIALRTHLGAREPRRFLGRLRHRRIDGKLVLLMMLPRMLLLMERVIREQILSLLVVGLRVSRLTLRDTLHARMRKMPCVMGRGSRAVRVATDIPRLLLLALVCPMVTNLHGVRCMLQVRLVLGVL
jgi:hypothetical protein